MRLKSFVLAALAATLAPAAQAGLYFQPSPAPSGARVKALAPDGATLWAATYRGVWKLSTGAWSLDGLGDRSVSSVAVSGGTAWAATGDALFRRAVDGSWAAETLPATTMQPTLLVADGDTLYVGGASSVANGPVLFRRASGSWSTLPSPGAGFPTALAADPAGLLVGLSSGAVSRLIGASFTAIGGFVGSAGGIQALLATNGLIYAGTSRDLWVWAGTAWAQDTPFGLHEVRAFTAAGGTLRVATADAGVLRSTGSGWTDDSSGLLTKRATSFALLGNDLHVGTDGGPVYRLLGSSWADTAPGTLGGAEVTDFAQVQNLASPVVATRGAGLTGATLPDGCGDVYAVALAPQDQGALAATNCGPLLESMGFSPVTAGLPSGASMTTLAETNGNVVGGTEGSGLWRLVGSTWSPDNSGLSDTAQVGTVRQVGLGLYAFVNGSVFSRGGTGTWNDISSGLPDDALVSSFSSGGAVFAGLEFGGVYRRDGDSDWHADTAGLLSRSVSSLDAVSGRLYAAAGTGGLFVKSGGGFRPENFGLPKGADATVVRGSVESAGASSRLYLYTGTAGHGAFKARAATMQRVVPVVLDVVGVGEARFRTELTLGVQGVSTQVTLTFTPAEGFGKGTIPVGSASVFLAANTELRIPDAFDWLRSLGMSIPLASESAPVLGTLALSAAPPGAADPLETEAVYAIARTYTTGSGGTFGLFYDAPSDLDTAEESATVYALRTVSGAARSHLALVHVPAGRGTDPITLSVQVYDATGRATGSPVLRTLAPGEWSQLNFVLDAAGLPDGSFGYAKVTRTSGVGTWLAYGVVNDSATSDGSYLAMQRPGGLGASRRQIVPVVLDLFGNAGSHYTTELTLVNDGPIGTPVDLTFQSAPGFGTVPGLPVITVNVPAHAQVTLADVLQTFRDKGVAVPRADQGGTAGSLSVDFRYLMTLDVGTTLALARTTTPNTDTATGGSFGLFYPAVARGGGARVSAVVPSLRQDGSARSNLAVVHVRGGADLPMGVLVQLYDATTGNPVGDSLTATLQAGEWKQWSSVMTLANVPATVTKTYAVITRTSGEDTFFAYGVQNDAVTSDGSYVAMIPLEKL